jgi:hypothetical protein
MKCLQQIHQRAIFIKLGYRLKLHAGKNNAQRARRPTLVLVREPLRCAAFDFSRNQLENQTSARQKKNL